MLETVDDLLRVINLLYPNDPPREFRRLAAVKNVRSGADASAMARSVRMDKARFEQIVGAEDPVEALVGCSLSLARGEESLRRARVIVGQLLLGQLAESAFERIYKATMGTDELALEDHRITRGDTDYRVLNGQRRPVFRINIKFHGTLFRDAREQVGLDPEDCFALATYKIHQALLKQDREVLPYLFVIVSVPGVTGGSVGDVIPDEFAHLVSLVHEAPKVAGKRSIEERVVDHLINAETRESFRARLQDFAGQIEVARWRVLSARRAEALLTKMLFQRVFAVRIRGFAQKYRRAELDMHFSLKDDLTPLQDFLTMLKEHGLHGLTARLERGLV